MNNKFNEDTLYQEIVNKWGEHGAHADVFRGMKKERDWVSVKAILPADKRLVIVTNEKIVGVAFYYKHSNTFCINDKKLPGVTRWLPLPKLPKT